MTATWSTLPLFFLLVCWKITDGRELQARQSQRPLADEHQNERQGSIDNLLEDAVLPPGHMSMGEDPEDSGCNRGTYLMELDVCLTPDQLAYFLPVNLPHLNTVASKSAAGAGKQLRQRRQVHQLIFSLWTGGAVPYLFNASFPHQDRQLVLSAMAEWERVTCIRFLPATTDDKDYVVFKDGRRCSTNIGKIGGQQTMTLAQPCRRKRILIHELGHVLGLIHEHQRQDRDNYVTVMMHNVRNSNQERYQFSKLAPGPLTEGPVPYSYTSIMHYGKNYFAKTADLTTLLTVDPGYQDVIGRADLPGFSDAEALNIMYGCGGVSRDRISSATCELLKMKGECDGHNRATVRSLCPRACPPDYRSYGTHVTANSFQPARATSTQSSAYPGKPHIGAPTWSPSSNAVGQLLGMRLMDSLFNYQQTAAASSSWSPVTPSPAGRLLSVFGNAPQLHANAMFRIQQQQQLHQEQLRQEQLRLEQQQQAQPQFIPEGLAKWLPPLLQKDGPSAYSRPSSNDNRNTLPSWMRSLQTPPAPPSVAKAAEEPSRKAGGADLAGARDVSMAAHNMKALSPEASPEAVARLTPSDGVEAAAAPPGQEPATYPYGGPQHLSLLESMLSHHQQLPSEPALQGVHTRRAVYRTVQGGVPVTQPARPPHASTPTGLESWLQQQMMSSTYGHSGSQGLPSSSPEGWVGGGRGGGGAPPTLQLFVDTANRTPRNLRPAANVLIPLGSVGPDHSFFG